MSELERARRALELGRLPNGIGYAIWPDSHDTVVSTQVWVRAGSADEPVGGTGLAHMLEHMMFRGTRAHPDGEFDAQMEALGASVNAATWLDYTVYMSTGAPGALDTVLSLEADRFWNLAIDPDAFAAERDVVANERRQVVDADPDAQLLEAFHAAAYGGTPYEWPTIGWEQDIAAFTPESLRGFYETHYRPENLMVVVCGGVDAAVAIDGVRRSFGCISASHAGPARSRMPTSATRPNRAVRELPITAPRLLLGWPAPPRAAASRAAWRVFDELFCAAESARLPVRLELRDRLVLDVASSLYPHRLTSLYELSLTLRPRSTERRVLGAIEEELAAIERGDVDDEALEGALARLRTQEALDLAETSARAERVGEAWAVAGTVESAFTADEALARVGVEDVRAVARELLAQRPHITVGAPAARRPTRRGTR
ncbi:MAG: insulinase family protein [Myxococcales bacterium]|nr:insulinase family protein [Myxococcales bacterium]